MGNFAKKDKTANQKSTVRRNATLILVLPGLTISLYLLFKSNFFCDYNTETFNNIITPIATILAFIIYYATLIEMRNSNQRNINFQKISLFKERIEHLKMRLENTPVNIPVQFQKNVDSTKSYNLTSFFQAYSSIHKEMRDNIENGETDIMNYSMFFFSICFDFKLHFDHIGNLINEIQKSDFDKLEKSTLTELLIKILNDYLYITSFGKEMQHFRN